jgi:CcmD family protein
MEATNQELYRLALHDAPFVIAAYGVLWVAFVVYTTMILRRILRLEKEVEVIESAVQTRSGDRSAA